MKEDQLSDKASSPAHKHQNDAGFEPHANGEISLAVKPGAMGNFLSLHQAAKMTGYHQDYLGQMARSGKLEAYKIGRNWQTTKEALNRMLGRATVTEDAGETEKVSPVIAPVAPALLDTLPATELEQTRTAEVNELRAPVQPTIKIDINFLQTSPDAGPNLQEAIAVARDYDREPDRAGFASRESKDFLYHWNRLANAVTPEEKNTTEMAQLKNSLRKLTRELSLAKKDFTRTVHTPAPAEPLSARGGFGYGAAALVLVVVSAAGMLYFGGKYISDIAYLSVSPQPQLQKMVAGESTQVYPSIVLWPPPYGPALDPTARGERTTSE